MKYRYTETLDGIHVRPNNIGIGSYDTYSKTLIQCECTKEKANAMVNLLIGTNETIDSQIKEKGYAEFSTKATKEMIEPNTIGQYWWSHNKFTIRIDPII